MLELRLTRRRKTCRSWTWLGPNVLSPLSFFLPYFGPRRTNKRGPQDRRLIPRAEKKLQAFPLLSQSSGYKSVGRLFSEKKRGDCCGVYKKHIQAILMWHNVLQNISKHTIIRPIYSIFVHYVHATTVLSEKN